MTTEKTKLEIIIDEEGTTTKIHVKKEEAYYLMAELINTIIKLTKAAHIDDEY